MEFRGFKYLGFVMGMFLLVILCAALIYADRNYPVGYVTEPSTVWEFMSHLGYQ